jgi:hypothetical protein
VKFAVLPDGPFLDEFSQSFWALYSSEILAVNPTVSLPSLKVFPSMNLSAKEMRNLRTATVVARLFVCSQVVMICFD